MFGYEFDNESLKKYTAIFGTLFNDIVISRRLDNGTIDKRFKVPIDFAPYQRFLVKLKQDPDLNNPVSIALPRMAFEITDIEYDSQNKVGNHGFRSLGNGALQYTSTPYKLSFSLYIMTKYIADGNQIVEQILPFFRPTWTSTVQLFPERPEFLIDIPLTLDSVSNEDGYENNFEERRVILWTLNFTMYVAFYGPVYQKKLIKFVKVNTFANQQSDVPAGSAPDEVITVQPGLDIHGNPTRDINNTIPYQSINADDNWDYIVQITDQDDT